MRNWVYRAVVALVRFVPEPVGYWTFARIGDLGWVLARSARRQVGQNIAVVAPQASDTRVLNRMTRIAFRNLLWGYYELFCLSERTGHADRARVEIDGLEHVRDAAAGRSPAIFAFTHTGSLEALSQVPLAFPKGNFVVLYGTLPNERIEALFEELRSSAGLQIISTREPRRLFESLRAGTSVIMASDLDSTGRGLIVDFFGKPARMPVGAVRLALRTGAPLHIVHAWRPSLRTPSRLHVCVHPRVELPEGDSLPRNIEDGVRRLASELEPVIATHPEQWLAFRNVWVEV